ncbi:MAG: NADH-quinone oxidoreductase subunit C, partial [Armatimonadetes bacterium]|nr:NADH-quinone oxidoreductase subunit C [Armatimonadota bacterium]
MSETDPDAVVDALEAALRKHFGDAVGERRQRHEMPEFDIAPERIGEVAAWLKAEQGLNFLTLLGGVDRLTHLDVVYFLESLPEPPAYGRLILRVKVDRAEPHAASCADVWEAANWHERECYDLLGVVFDGHPDLRR